MCSIIQAKSKDSGVGRYDTWNSVKNRHYDTSHAFFWPWLFNSGNKIGIFLLLQTRLQTRLDVSSAAKCSFIGVKAWYKSFSPFLAPATEILN